MILKKESKQRLLSSITNVMSLYDNIDVERDIINIYERSERVKVSGWNAGVSIFLFVRQVDGSGAENTLDVKLISFAVWLGFYLCLLALEYGIRFLCVIRKK